MKSLQRQFACTITLWAVALGLNLANTPANATETANAGPGQASEAIPWSQIGAKAGADYQGDGLVVRPTAEGALLRCVFQRLEGEATREGLWLTSTVTNVATDRFRLVAAEVGRVTLCAPGAANRTSNIQLPTSNIQLESTGNISVDGQCVRFTRPGLVEEYTVSMDGLRQDFVIGEKPGGTRELCVTLAVDGARVEPAAFGARLVLENSGRKIAYSRLRVTDATGKELTARMEVVSGILPDVEGAHPAARSLAADSSTASWQGTPESAGLEASALRQAGMLAATALAVVVNDAGAVYPIRIDPTFSDANWISMGGVPGVEGTVNAATIDGSGNLYVGGRFFVAGEVFANNIAKWDGNSWSALGAGVNSNVYALAVSGSNVYAGGDFTTAGGIPASRIAKWDGNTWSALGLGLGSFFQPPAVFALAASGSNLYAGGSFLWVTNSDGTSLTVNYVAKWDGSNWMTLGSGRGGQVRALATSGGDLYAGGPGVAKWDGTNWSALGQTFTVHALAVSGSNVYAGGGFTTPGNYVVKWDGNNWSPLGSGMNFYVDALAASGDELYAGGAFTMAGGSAANYIAKWDGSIWTPLGSGRAPGVYALAVSGSNVYAGGFTGLARWDGAAWSGLGSGMQDTIWSLAILDTNLFACGRFFISKWNGSRWSELAPGIDGLVFALAVSGGDLYAGGSFTTLGGTFANRIARWDGSHWSPLGSGMNSYVNALAVSGNEVYAGGEFTTAGGSQANYVAKWDGSSWSPLGLGMNGEVNALAMSGSTLYAGGAFTNAGGNPANYVSKWDGTNWAALGSGVNTNVYALAVSGSQLYAGGRLTMAGGSPANYIAKWNGTSWSPLGLGVNSFVNALALSGSDLYVGGNFSMAGGNSARRIAKWNGSSWSALGSGMNNAVRALVVTGNDLYAGGSFYITGGKVSGTVVRAYLPDLPELSVLRSGPDIMVSWPSVDTTDFALEQASTLAAPISWVTNSASVTEDGINKSVTIPSTNGPQFFRLRRP